MMAHSRVPHSCMHANYQASMTITTQANKTKGNPIQAHPSHFLIFFKIKFPNLRSRRGGGGAWWLRVGSSLIQSYYFILFVFFKLNNQVWHQSKPNMCQSLYIFYFILFLNYNFHSNGRFSSIIWMQDFHPNLDEKFSSIHDFRHAISFTYMLGFLRLSCHWICFGKLYATTSLYSLLDIVILGVQSLIFLFWGLILHKILKINISHI